MSKAAVSHIVIEEILGVSIVVFIIFCSAKCVKNTDEPLHLQVLKLSKSLNEPSITGYLFISIQRTWVLQ